MSTSLFTGKQKSLAIIPKVTGFLSFAGSLFVIYDILLRKKENGSNSSLGATRTRKQNWMYRHIMLGLSIFDSIASFVNILSTWPTPSDQGDLVYGALGTTTTCTLQGFFNEFGNITTPLYSASLSIWHLLFLKYGWREKDCEGIEYIFHFIPTTVGLAMTIAGLPLELYNNSGFLCWYAPYPAGCDKVEPHICTRGEYAGMFRWIHYAIVWSSIVIVTYNMASIYFAVRLQEEVVRNTLITNTARKKSRAVAEQACFYICALYLTWAFTSATRISQTTFKYNSYELLVLMATFFPLQGFWNALIYFRPRYKKIHQQKLRPQRSQRPIESQSKYFKNTDKISREKIQDVSKDLPTKPMEIWERVKLRQLEQAQAALEKAEKDEEERLEEEQEQQKRIWSDQEYAVESLESGEVEFLESGEIERHTISIVHPSLDLPTTTRSSGSTDESTDDRGKSLWKTVIPL